MFDNAKKKALKDYVVNDLNEKGKQGCYVWVDDNGIVIKDYYDKHPQKTIDELQKTIADLKISVTHFKTKLYGL